ncbi:MAG: lipoprotein [Gammaproteobacteria bacterium]|jgi:predicted small lipoprotein YifL
MNSRRRLPWRAAVTPLLLAIAACGQTGPLVLPGSPPQDEPPPAQTSSETEPDEDEE